MPPHGKPVSNPFHHALESSAQTTGVMAGAKHSAPDRERSGMDMIQPGCETRRRNQKGISNLAGDDRLEMLPMRKASLISTALHVVAPFAFAVLAFITLLLLSWLLHFNLWDWLNKPKPPDMVFSLVNDTHAQKPEKAVFKGNFNQRAGGKHSPTPRPAEAALRPQAPKQQKAEKAHARPPVKAPPPMPQTARPVAQAVKPVPQPKPHPVKKTVEKPPTIATPAKPTRPANRQPTKPTMAAQSQPAENTLPRKSGPAMQARTPSAQTAPDGSGALSEAVDQGGSLKSGVDVAQDVDYGPFMEDLQRRIRRNWQAPRMDRSTKIVVEFYVGRGGQLVSADGEPLDPREDAMDVVKILKSSGNPDSDRAAVEAVRLSAPFKAFPPQEKADLLPINFTFDYNVLNPGGSRRASKS